MLNEEFDIDIENSLMIGDNLEADILGAANVGLGTVWMNSQQLEWPKKYQKPDMTIVNISELCNLLIPKIN